MHFSIRPLEEYSNLYLKPDALLLSEIYEDFGSMCRQTYGLDPPHYFTLTEYSLDCMLKIFKMSARNYKVLIYYYFMENKFEVGSVTVVTDS